MRSSEAGSPKENASKTELRGHDMTGAGGQPGQCVHKPVGMT
jgi:hypothetical protein